MRIREFGDRWNFWVVKYFRQLRHSHGLVIAVGVLALAQIVIYRICADMKNYSRHWPEWWFVLLLIGCGLATTLCVARSFSAQKISGGNSVENEHFFGFAPLNIRGLFFGHLLCHLLTFVILLAVCTAAWMVVFYQFPDKAGLILLYMLNAYLISFFVLPFYIMHYLRPDILLLYVANFILLFNDKLNGKIQTFFCFFLIVAIYFLIDFYEALKPRILRTGIGVKIAQLGMLIAGIVLCWHPFSLRIPVLIVAAATGAFASMGAALEGIPTRQLNALSTNYVKRFCAYLGYSSSAGSWIWCWVIAVAALKLLPQFGSRSSYWAFLISLGLVCSEMSFFMGNNLMRRLGCMLSEKGYYGVLLGGYFVFSVAVMLFSVTTKIKGEEVFQIAANLGWALAILFLVLNLPRMYRDFVQIVLGRR
ncbi:MAG: hypothetical protein LBM70_02985 [Victivallales bacterium]|jgi:hypothetical protein|nr:hypothetical protein [Victivallales bacterium]